MFQELDVPARKWFKLVSTGGMFKLGPLISPLGKCMSMSRSSSWHVFLVLLIVWEGVCPSFPICHIILILILFKSHKKSHLCFKSFLWRTWKKRCPDIFVYCMFLIVQRWGSFEYICESVPDFFNSRVFNCIGQRRQNKAPGHKQYTEVLYLVHVLSQHYLRWWKRKRPHIA